MWPFLIVWQIYGQKQVGVTGEGYNCNNVIFDDQHYLHSLPWWIKMCSLHVN